MIRFDVITIFPEAFDSYLASSMLKRAREKGRIDVLVHNLRDFSGDRHRTVDGSPYGGGPGMVFKIEPLAKALSAIIAKGKRAERRKIILFSAGGKQFSAKHASEWARSYDRLILIAGHYEGVDARFKKLFPTEEISVGPYVLTGGELPALVVIDAVSRHIPGVLGKSESLEEGRYGVGLPTYTRPEVFTWKGKSLKVPGVLLSGDHKKIDEWRRKYGRR